MQRNTSTAIIYGLAASACSAFLLCRNSETDGRWSALFLFWLFAGAVPLLFVFAYPRFLFADSAPQNRGRYAALLHGLAAVTATVLFSLLSPFWKNPARDNDSMALAIGILIVWGAILVAALFLLVKHKSTLAVVASLLFWPYWLLLALVFAGRWFQDTGIYAAYYFLCFLTPVLLALAAGAISYRPTFAHAAAFMGLLGAPWLYLNVMRDSGLGNVWLVFNEPHNEFGKFSIGELNRAALAIFAIALLALAAATAAVRLLPFRWHLGKHLLRDRTWPGFVASFVVLAVWFSQSVMPYRIPGALDYSDWPILQILHVEKRGLQFHERCIKVWGRRGQPTSVSFSDNDRRLFQYRFQDKGSSGGQLPQSFAERVRALLPVSRQRRASDIVKPIRAWNAERWYFYSEGSGLRIYDNANGLPPSQEVIDLFHDLSQMPRSSENQSELRDVCLGFCYDPLSDMGYLYANHRCFNDGHGLVCR